MSTLIRCVAIVFLAHVLLVTPVRAQDGDITISEINIEGAKRVSPSTILSYMPVSVGDKISQDQLNGIISSLFATDLFHDVSLRLDGDKLVVVVDENPIINRVNIEGNDVIEDERLLEILNIRPRRVFTRKIALDGKAVLMEVYRQNGRYAATIEPKIIELPDKRVDLIFEVDEGPLIKISKVKFIGNQQFSDRALRNVITSRERKWYIFLSGNDKYDAARLALDEQQLREFYLQNGFADFGVLRSSGELLPDRSGFVLTFLVDEGQQYTVSDVVINSGIENVDADTLLKESTISVGDIYDVRYLDETLSKLTDKLGEFGYAFVNVEPDFELDKENASLQVIINIDRAQRNFVEEIRINGNDRTLDRVIRRRFEIVEGDSFNQLRLSNSIRNIRNLGYFSNVQSKVLPGSQSDQSVIDLTVEEQSTGTFSLGFGYSSLDDASVQIGIEESNFLGTGRGVRASAAVSSNKTNFRLGITEPYLWDRELLGSIDAFRDENKYSDVTIERLGLDTAVGFRARDNYYHRISYLLAETQTSTSSTTATSTSGDDGGKIISELGYTLSQDKRDNRFDPREGYYWRLSNSFSGIGGDVQYIKSTARGQYFMPFAFKRAVLGFDGKIGVVDGLGEDVSRSNRFVIGGRDIRGFESDGIGPRDTGDDSAVGGNQYYSGSVNIVSDLGLDPDLSVRWTVFYDFGSLWGVDNTSGITGADDDMMRSTFGYGFFWDTAIGPLTFSWTVPISEESYDETQSFQFSFGGRF
jgi:outer membrane protein insertion porin family